MPQANAKLAAWMPWIVIALVATTAGLLLPQMLPNEPVLSKAAAKGEVKAKSDLEYEAPTLPEPPDFHGMIARLGAGTVLVLILCVASMWALRRWMNPALATPLGQRQMRLLETLNLGNRCCLHLVHVGKREVLIGVDGAGVKSIVPLAEPFEEVLATAEDEPLPRPRLAV